MTFSVRFSWRGLGFVGSADTYTRGGFATFDEAEEFRLEVLEGRRAPKGQQKAPAEWTVRCASGARRRLGTNDFGQVIRPKGASAPAAKVIVPGLAPAGVAA